MGLQEPANPHVQQPPAARFCQSTMAQSSTIRRSARECASSCTAHTSDWRLKHYARQGITRCSYSCNIQVRVRVSNLCLTPSRAYVKRLAFVLMTPHCADITSVHLSCRFDSRHPGVLLQPKFKFRSSNVPQACERVCFFYHR
jgi:hypothetical protein